MDPHALSAELEQQLLAFCWSEWAQMGLLAAAPERPSRWAQDPEALIVLTLEIGRVDPRLFGELLDWMALNERLLSQRRLRALCVDAEDRALVASAIGWLSWQRPQATNRAAPPTWDGDSSSLRPLFHRGGPVGELDPSFAAAGLASAPLRRSGKSSPPNLSRPINLSLRLRAILGVGIRAEVVRVMLGQPTAWMSAQGLSRASAFSKRNVHDALSGLAQAGVIAVADVGSELRYTIDAEAWAALLGCSSDRLPAYREWRWLLGVLRQILRWSAGEAQTWASDYMVASGARQLLDRLRKDIALAGIAVPVRLTADEAPGALHDLVGAMLSSLCLSASE